jgi:hypothetical protein
VAWVYWDLKPRMSNIFFEDVVQFRLGELKEWANS